MAKLTTVERIAILETKFDILKETVEVGFKELGEKIDGQSLNGETPRVKNMSKVIGDPEDVAIIKAIVETHKRRVWFATPFRSATDKIASAVLWFGTAAVLGLLASWLHMTFPHLLG